MNRTQPTRLATTLILAGLLLAVSVSTTGAQGGLFGIGGKTLGGRFVWSDEVVLHDWRVQKHAVMGHYRLIDPKDRRVTFGSFDHCLTRLAEIKREQELPPMATEIVVVLHGLGASRQMMDGLSDHLADQGGLSVVNVGYPSTLAEIGEHAKSLASVLQHLEGVETVSFVAHSMGNLVIRHCLSDLAALPEAEQPKLKYKYFVMLAPPNHGAAMADSWADNEVAKIFAGKPLKQLAPGHGWEELEPHLATPDFEFGILAGGSGDSDGYLAAIPGDDDMLLSLETTKLAGASDFAQVNGIHQLLPRYKQVREYTLRFLQKGYFISAQMKQPVVLAADLPVDGAQH